METTYDADWIVARPPRHRGIRKLLDLGNAPNIDEMAAEDRCLAFAIAEVRMMADEHPGSARIEADSVWMRHRTAASLEGDFADALGLPPLVDLTFRTDVEGALGTETFRLRSQWSKLGRRKNPKRVGAILITEDGDRRLPLWLLDAIEVAEGFTPGTDLAEHWEALARFRRALKPGVDFDADPATARVSMTRFLQGLEVRLADSFGVSPKPSSENTDLLDFDPVPYSAHNLAGVGEGEVTESHSELRGGALVRFQERVRQRGSLPAYRVGDGSYIVIERRAQTVLDVMCRMQRADAAERDAFVRNPRAAISEAVANRLREDGDLQDLSPDEEARVIEEAAEPAFIETVEYSARVTGVTMYRDPELELPSPTHTTWLPESFGEAARAIEAMEVEELDDLATQLRGAVEEGREHVRIGDTALPATRATVEAVQRRRAEKAEQTALERIDDPSDEREESEGPLILDTKENFAKLEWHPELSPRAKILYPGIPKGIATTLKDYQAEGVAWLKECWSVGLPGVLNADEQGLGKTLQSIAFLRFLQDWMAEADAAMKQPVLVVAPTSLLKTWEAEVKRHADSRGLGQVIRLYGASLGGHRVVGSQGVDTESGQVKLEFGPLMEAIQEGRGHRFWVLTTYTTLTNYQHSLARIPFSAAVFDEIQALKNPATLRSFAARAIRADFRIGLTGTPIENRTCDLWAILDQLAPGALGALEDFNSRFAVPDEHNMQDLHQRVFTANGTLPRLALRRTKSEVAKQLPKKERRLHPRLMPKRQTAAYDAAKLKLGTGRSILKALHHIRSVSVHPDLAAGTAGGDFVGDSARIEAAFEVIRRIRERRERALVFIEHRRVQYQFAELAQREFDLPRIDIINGNTPIPRRQLVVERFQRHMSEDGGFDLLILGTRAAGTGLTLTAATHVIHVSRWWNPAVEEQCNDRVHRIGQDRPVTIHVPMAIHPQHREGSFDCLLHNLMNRKRQLASSALWPMGDTAADATDLRRGISGSGPDESRIGNGEPVRAAMAAMFQRDGKPLPQFAPDGSLEYE